MLRTIFWTFISGILWLNCKPGTGAGEDDPFAKTDFNAYDNELGSRVEAYHATVCPWDKRIRKGNPSLYIDFSSGIYEALKAKGNLPLLTGVYNSLPTNALDIFKLSSDQMVKMLRTDIDAEVTNPARYKEVYAPITQAVSDIVSKENDALLVTDFEEYGTAAAGARRAEITDIAYLKDLFIQWLAAGNSIHFFISDYQEKNIDKRLFFTVFTYGRISDESLLKRIESIGLNSGLTRYDLSNRSMPVTQGYDAGKTGGIFYDLSGKTDNQQNILALNKGQYVNGLKRAAGNFELYPFDLYWKTIGEQREAYKGQFMDLFRKIFLDISNEDSYRIESLSVKVTDITSDFEYFAKCLQAAKRKPSIQKGSKGEDRLSDTVKDPIALGCYEPSGKLKSQWVYSPQKVSERSDMFAFNRELFENTIRSNGRNRAELAVSFDPMFNPKNIPAGCHFLRIDIVVEKAVPSLTGTKIAKFSWRTRNGLNTALSASVTNALADPKVRPENQVVYTYYVRTLD